MPQPFKLDDKCLLDALRAMGGMASMSELKSRLPQHRNTLRRHLKVLVGHGVIDERARGKYELVKHQSTLSSEAAHLVDVLRAKELDAHLTGLDLLVTHAHQFVFQFPHVVYADPMTLDAVEVELVSHDFIVQPANSSCRISVSNPSKLVLLRKQAGAELYRVHGFIAPVEKAWVDTLREAIRGVVPIQFMELGRILRSLEDGGADMRFLRRYARQLGYLTRVDAALGSTPDHSSQELLALRAGYAE